MAEIFKAKLVGISGFEKPMVLKQILPHHAQNADFVKMFIEEAKLAVTLTHGNIVPVYELGRVNDIYFMAMEYLPGRDLAEVLQCARDRGQPLSVEHAVFIAIEICKGLDYAHRRLDAGGRPQGIVHRDISPPNALISFEGQVKITDFGMAKALSKLETTGVGFVKGTLGYLSPEQANGLVVDHRTDIFSTGIVLHEMLTGRRLFVGKSDHEALQRLKEARVPAPSTMNPKVPGALDPILFKALARDPNDRYATANELQLALSRFLFTSGAGASASTLSQYMCGLFADELRQAAPTTPTDAAPEGQAHPAPVDDNSRSYAIRPELTRETAPAASPRLGAPIDVGVGQNRYVDNATLALPSLSEAARQQGAPPLFADDVPASSATDDDVPTEVSPRESGPQRPAVPALRVPVAARPPASSANAPSRGGPSSGSFPSPEEFSDLLDGLQELQSAPRLNVADAAAGEKPAPHSQPIPAPAPAPTSVPRRPSVTSPVQDASTPRTPAAPRAAAPRHKQSGLSSILTGTMRLFVGGLDQGDEEEGFVPETETDSSSASVAALAELSGRLKVPRTIKPTLFGWIVVGLLVVGALFFVVYKKTTWLRSGASAEGTDSELLNPEELSGREPAPEERKGNITVSSEPAGASFFLFVGETPVVLDQVDPQRAQLLLVDREGYRSIYREVKPAELAKQGQPTIELALEPLGAGQTEPVPAFSMGGSLFGGKGSLRIVSQPPKAMVWRLVAQGEALTLKQVSTRRSYYIKVLHAGYKPSSVSISEVDFPEGKNDYSTTIKLEAEEAASAEKKEAVAQETPQAAPTEAAATKASPIKATPTVKAPPTKASASSFARVKPRAPKDALKAGAKKAAAKPKAKAAAKAAAKKAKPAAKKAGGPTPLATPDWAQ